MHHCHQTIPPWPKPCSSMSTSLPCSADLPFSSTPFPLTSKIAGLPALVGFWYLSSRGPSHSLPATFVKAVKLFMLLDHVLCWPEPADRIDLLEYFNISALWLFFSQRIGCYRKNIIDELTVFWSNHSLISKLISTLSPVLPFLLQHDLLWLRPQHARCLMGTSLGTWEFLSARSDRLYLTAPTCYSFPPLAWLAGCDWHAHYSSGYQENQSVNQRGLSEWMKT